MSWNWTPEAPLFHGRTRLTVASSVMCCFANTQPGFAPVGRLRPSPQVHLGIRKGREWIRGPFGCSGDYFGQVYCSPAATLLPQRTLLPHNTLLPQRTLLPHNTFEPHRTLEPHNTLEPQSTLLPQRTLLPDTFDP